MLHETSEFDLCIMPVPMYFALYSIISKYLKNAKVKFKYGRNFTI